MAPCKLQTRCRKVNPLDNVLVSFLIIAYACSYFHSFSSFPWEGVKKEWKYVESVSCQLCIIRQGTNVDAGASSEKGPKTEVYGEVKLLNKSGNTCHSLELHVGDTMTTIRFAISDMLDVNPGDISLHDKAGNPLPSRGPITGITPGTKVYYCIASNTHRMVALEWPMESFIVKYW